MEELGLLIYAPLEIYAMYVILKFGYRNYKDNYSNLID